MGDFVILKRIVDGRSFDRYYHSWMYATDVLLDEVREVCNPRNGHYVVERIIDRFNSSKGFYEFEHTLKSKKDGTLVKLALVDGYFSD